MSEYESENPVQQRVMRRLFSAWPLTLYLLTIIAITYSRQYADRCLNSLLYSSMNGGNLDLYLRVETLVFGAFYGIWELPALLLIFKVLLKNEIRPEHLPLLRLTPVTLREIVAGIVWPVWLFIFLVGTIRSWWGFNGVFGDIYILCYRPEFIASVASSRSPYFRLVWLPLSATHTLLSVLLAALAFAGVNGRIFFPILRLSAQLIAIGMANYQFDDGMRRIFYAHNYTPTGWIAAGWDEVPHLLLNIALIACLWQWRIKKIDWPEESE